MNRTPNLSTELHDFFSLGGVIIESSISDAVLLIYNIQSPVFLSTEEIKEETNSSQIAPNSVIQPLAKKYSHIFTLLLWLHLVYSSCLFSHLHWPIWESHTFQCKNVLCYFSHIHNLQTSLHCLLICVYA